MLQVVLVDGTIWEKGGFIRDNGGEKGQNGLHGDYAGGRYWVEISQIPRKTLKRVQCGVLSDMAYDNYSCIGGEGWYWVCCW